MHVAFDYKTAPLLIAKYSSIRELGKVIESFHVEKAEESIHKVYFYFAIVDHLAHPFFSTWSLAL